MKTILARDGMLVLASNYETAMEITAIFRTDVQRIICKNYESAMRVIRDQMNMGAQFTLSPAAASVWYLTTFLSKSFGPKV